METKHGKFIYTNSWFKLWMNREGEDKDGSFNCRHFNDLPVNNSHSFLSLASKDNLQSFS